MPRADHDPFWNGIPDDIYDRAVQWIYDRYEDEDPSEDLILDVAYGIYEDDVRKATEDREISRAQNILDGG